MLCKYVGKKRNIYEILSYFMNVCKNTNMYTYVFVQVQDTKIRRRSEEHETENSLTE